MDPKYVKYFYAVTWAYVFGDVAYRGYLADQHGHDKVHIPFSSIWLFSPACYLTLLVCSPCSCLSIRGIIFRRILLPNFDVLLLQASSWTVCIAERSPLVVPRHQCLRYYTRVGLLANTRPRLTDGRCTGHDEDAGLPVHRLRSSSLAHHPPGRPRHTKGSGRLVCAGTSPRPSCRRVCHPPTVALRGRACGGNHLPRVRYGASSVLSCCRHRNYTARTPFAVFPTAWYYDTPDTASATGLAGS